MAGFLVIPKVYAVIASPFTLSHGLGTHCAKIALIVWPEIPQMPHKISAQFVCPSPKVSNFSKKALSGCPYSVHLTI